MSLIHEALRKARRESAEEDKLGVVYSRGLTGRRGRRGVGSGIALGVLLTIAVGAVIAGALWLRLGRQGVSSTAAAEQSAGPRLATAAPGPPAAAARAEPSAPTPMPNAAATAAQPGPPAAEGQDGDAGPRPDPLTAAEPAPAADSPPVATSAPAQNPAASNDRQGAPTPAAPMRAKRTSGERVFEVEADLGYVTLTVDYIVFRPTDPFAQINGVDVRVGSTIEGFTVDEIGSRSVKLHDAKGPLVLQVP